MNEEIFELYISSINDKLGIDRSELERLLVETISSISLTFKDVGLSAKAYKTKEQSSLKQNNNQNSSDQTSSSKQNSCQMILKSGIRKGQLCGTKLKGNGQYCNRHNKTSKEDERNEPPMTKFKPTKESSVEELKIKGNEPLDEFLKKIPPEGLIFKKNKHGYFQFGETGLVFKSCKEKVIIGKQLDNGEIQSLTEEDIMICKKYKLRYCSELKESNENNVILSTKEFTSKIPL